MRNNWPVFFDVPEHAGVNVIELPPVTVVDRRSEPRHAATGTARVRIAPGSPVVDARLLEVSKSGLRIQLDAPLKLGTTIEIELDHLFAMGIVRHCRKFAGQYYVGLRLEAVINKTAVD